MESKLPVSACFIVKNEELFLDTALKSIRNVMGLSDIIVVDTGSDDRTKEIALDNKVRLFDFTWCDDFSAARNFSASKAENDWILWMDADEEVTQAEFEGMDDFFKSIEVIGMVTFVDLVDKLKGRAPRMYNRSAYRFEGNIHEQLRAINGRESLITTHLNVSLVHHGYLPEYGRVLGKLERNERLLLKELKKKPNDVFLLYQLGKSYFCDNRDLLKACECFEKALTIGVDVTINYTYNLVECYGYALVNTGQYEKALKLRDTFAEHYDNRAQFRFLSAHIYQNNGLFQEAVESYYSCIGAETNDMKGISSFLSYYNIGVIYECLGMIEDARKMYLSCGDFEPAVARLKAIT
jgi:hypothetical protein